MLAPRLMLCEKCKKEVASVHIAESNQTTWKQTNHHFCPSCAEQFQLLKNMDPIVHEVACKKCGHKELIGYSALKSKTSHNCAKCGEAIDLAPYLRAGDAFVKRYGLAPNENAAE